MKKNTIKFSFLILTSLIFQNLCFSQEDTLKSNNQVVEEIQLGYTHQSKEDLSSSVSTISSNDLMLMPSGNITNQLQGMASGISVIGNGQPGETSRLRVRGFSSFTNNDPLYIIDGVPAQDISSLNPADVESISILKDAGASAIYGSRASSGVLIVTTKKGIKGTHVSYNAYYGVQNPGSGPDNLLDTKEYGNLQWLVYRNDNITGDYHPVYGPSSNPAPTYPDWAANTDWYKVITRKAQIMNHDISFSGASDHAKFYAGIGIFSQDGIIIYTDYSRYSARFNSEFSILNDHVKIGENISLSYQKRHKVKNLDESSPILEGVYESQSIIPSIITIPINGGAHSFVPGEWGGTGIAYRLGSADNELATLTRAKDNENWNTGVNGNVYADVEILKGLNFRSAYGGTFNNFHQNAYQFMTYESSANYYNNSFTELAAWSGDWVWTNTLAFDRSVGANKVSALAGYEAVNYGNGRVLTGTRSGYFIDDVLYRTLDNGANIVQTASSATTPSKLSSLFIKADLVFSNKYILSAGYRRDGSSKFGKSNRYGGFPYVSAGWHISNESFINKVSWISDLKIRGSWGITGNQFALSPQNAFFVFAGNPGASYYDLNGTFNSSLPGLYPVQMANPDVRWESCTSTNIGIESRFLKNKLGLTIDLYSRNNNDLLFKPQLPSTAGGSEEAPFINLASMKNTGIDLDLNYSSRWRDLRFSWSLIFTSYKNRITEIANLIDFFYSGGSRIGAFVRNETGYPLSSFYGYRVAGIFKNETEVTNAPYQNGAEPGFFRFENISKGGSDGESITSEDRTMIGDPNPKFTYGINLSFYYKKFDLTCFVFGSKGNDIFNYTKWFTDFWPSFQGQKSKELLYQSWTETNRDATVPKATYTSGFSTNTQSCSYYIEDGSYLRLKTLQIGYTLQPKVPGKTGIGTLRFYLQAVNLFTKTKYSGLDPEIGGPDVSFGIDSGNYPASKQFIFGLNLTI